MLLSEAHEVPRLEHVLGGLLLVGPSLACLVVEMQLVVVFLLSEEHLLCRICVILGHWPVIIFVVVAESRRSLQPEQLINRVLSIMLLSLASISIIKVVKGIAACLIQIGALLVLILHLLRFVLSYISY